MNELISLVGIVAAISLGTVSPGPSFVVVARTAVAKSRAHGVASALGMGFGASFLLGPLCWGFKDCWLQCLRFTSR